MSGTKTPGRCAGVVATACTQGKRTQHGKPQGVVRDDQPDAREGQAGRPGVTERFAVPRKPGNAGGGKGPQFKTNARRSEGPINSEECSETADGVARESEGRSRLSVLCPVRQDQPRRHSGLCLCSVSLEQGHTGCGWSGLRGHRGVWGAAVAWRTGACARAGDVSTGPYQKSVHTEGQWQTLHDGSDAGAGADLRSRPSTRTV